jgi:hypothetical protein
MSQPVKLSDTLVLEARLTGKAMERSIAGQVEYWARLGKAVESLLTIRQVTALGSEAVLARLDDVDTPAGRQRVKDYLESGPYPRFTAYPDGGQLLIREDADGKKTVGRFLNREFVPVKRGRKTVAA